MRVRSLKRVLRKPQTVESGGEKAECGKYGERNVGTVGPKQDEKFTDEISKPRKPKRRHGKYKAGSAQSRHRLP